MEVWSSRSGFILAAVLLVGLPPKIPEMRVVPILCWYVIPAALLITLTYRIAALF